MWGHFLVPIRYLSDSLLGYLEFVGFLGELFGILPIHRLRHYPITAPLTRCVGQLEVGVQSTP